jgi:hypothetical protein
MSNTATEDWIQGLWAFEIHFSIFPSILSYSKTDHSDGFVLCNFIVTLELYFPEFPSHAVLDEGCQDKHAWVWKAKMTQQSFVCWLAQGSCHHYDLHTVWLISGSHCRCQGATNLTRYSLRTSPSYRSGTLPETLEKGSHFSAGGLYSQIWRGKRQVQAAATLIDSSLS